MLKNVEAVCMKCAPVGMTVLRIVVGIILIYHGYPKLFGDTTSLLAFFESTILPFPKVMLWCAGMLELFGGGALILGIFTRFISTLLVIEFLVIVLFVKSRLGFSSMELDLLLLGALFTISSIGAGRYSVDELLEKKFNKSSGSHGGHGGEAIGG